MAGGAQSSSSSSSSSSSNVWSQRVTGTLKLCKFCLMWLTALSTVALFALSVWTYSEHGLVYPCPENPLILSEPWQHHRLITQHLVRVLIALFSVLVMEFYSASAHLQLASWLGLAQWHCQVAVQANSLLRCRYYGRVSFVGPDVWVAASVGWMVAMYSRVVVERWVHLAVVAGGGHQGKTWKCYLLLILGYCLLTVAVFGLAVLGILPPHVPFFFYAPGGLTVFGLFVRLAWPSLRLVIGAKHAALRAALPGRAERIRWAASSVLLQFVGTLAAGGSTTAWTLMQLWAASGQVHPNEPGDLPFFNIFDVVSLLYVLCNTFLLLSLEGIFSGAGRHARLRSRAARAREARWRSNWESWQRRRGEEAKDSPSYSRPPSQSLSHKGETGSDADSQRNPEPLRQQQQWDEKVRELAGRGVSLDALLQFYRQTLPGVMPHFDPQRHTTGNVVFEVVIPYTSERGCAAADLMMAGQYVLPRKMVTHNWGNKFSDLLAAIVSDAISESDFGMVAWLLVHDPDKLEAWIADLKVGSRTYWICAFAVNQHISICGTRRGTVCRCNRQKFLNDSPPLMPDGSSIPCEVNKFDSMMKYLSAANPAFEQLVAVDVKCDLFWRAWCIAEIATAHETGMPQTLKVTSPDSLEANLGKLGELKIEDMDASRKEDKELILGRIESPEDFNKTLRHVLLNEVIPAWSSLDAAEQMSLAGCIIRWQRVSQCLGDSTVWSA